MPFHTLIDNFMYHINPISQLANFNPVSEDIPANAAYNLHNKNVRYRKRHFLNGTIIMK